MTAGAKNGTYFWLLNLAVVVAVLLLATAPIFAGGGGSPYLLRLSELPHFVTDGPPWESGGAAAREVPAGENVASPLREAGLRRFLQPGEMPYDEFTITVRFDFTAQYDALAAQPDVIPALSLPGLGDSFELYLNGQLVASEWHVEEGRITRHSLARSAVYPINPRFFLRGENTLAFRIYGDPTSFDTGLTVTDRYLIDDMRELSLFDYSQIIFAGIYLAVAITFSAFFLLYREKRLNLWFSITALSISLYALFRVGALGRVVPDYEVSLRLEVLSLFTVAHFITVLIYTCGKERFNLGMKVYTGLYTAFSAAVLLPGHQFVLDLVKVYFLLFVPFIFYAFFTSLCLPLIREVRAAEREEGGTLHHLLRALSGTLRGNMIVGAFVPILLAVADQMAYVLFSYQEIVMTQYGFLFFFTNVTFALASDNAEMHNRLMALSGELRTLVSERESQLERKSDEVEEARSAQLHFREMVSREIRAPLGELIGAIELRLLRGGLSADATNWLGRLLTAQHGVRRKLDGFLGSESEQPEAVGARYRFDSPDEPGGRGGENPGGTRHLFVINPKSFVTLRDLKDFLLSIEKCFSAGHRAEYKIYISRYPRDAYSAVHRYLAATPPDETARVYAVGGDGILFDCLNGLARFPNAELAPIPYGNANDFARAFGAENIEFFRDIKRMSKAPARLVDAILCGEQYALCGCSIGIEAKAVQVFSNFIERINTGRARRFVPLLYNLGAVKALFDAAPNNLDYRLTLDGEDCSGAYLFLNVGNIALNGGSNVPNPLAVPEDGLLDLIRCTPSSIPNALRMLPGYTAGQFTKFPDYMDHRRFKELHCESDSLMSVVLDGETFYTHELSLKLLPKAVKIISPGGIGFADYSHLRKGGVK